MARRLDRKPRRSAPADVAEWPCHRPPPQQDHEVLRGWRAAVAASVEREVKLLAESDFAMPDLSEIRGVVAAVEPEKQLEAVYFDTPGLRLARWGITLRHRGDGWTLKLPMDDGQRVLSRYEVGFQGPPDAPPEGAVAAVAALVHGEALAAVAEMTTLRRMYRLRDTGGLPLAAVADDLVEVRRDGAAATRFHQLEVELAPAVGHNVCKRVVRLLRAAGARRAPLIPKLLQGLEARPLAADRAPALREAIRHALSAGVRRLAGHDPSVRLDVDHEGVHQIRAAARQLRSDLAAFRAVLGGDPRSEALRGELRWLGQSLGSVRDADVLSQRLDRQAAEIAEADVPAARRLLAKLAAERDEALTALLADMSGARYRALFSELAAVAEAPAVTGGDRPAAEVLAPLLRRAWRRLAAAVAGLPSEPTDAELHRIRIRAKRARYTAEAVAPVLGPRAGKLAQSLAGLQTVLGELQDGMVAEAWLRQAVRRAPAPALAAGQLIAMARRDQAAARSGWLEAFETAVRRARRMGLRA